MKSMKFLYILAGLFGTFVNCYDKHDKFVEKTSNTGIHTKLETVFVRTIV